MIYDCFTFFDELDILDIRLNVLNDVVDKFVIVEAVRTHSCKDKELVFEANRQRYSKFADKIVYVVPETYPEFKTSWTYENYQRNCIADGLKGCKPDDTILISDCDEIPNPKVIRKYAGTKGIKILEQFMFFYFLNNLDVGYPIWDGGTRMMSYSDFLHGLDGLKLKYNDYCIRELNQGTTATALRLWKHAERIENGGWHFSFLGGIDAIVKKISSYSHQEYNRNDITDPVTIQAKIAKGEDIFGRPGHAYQVVRIDDCYPEWIRNNTSRLSSMINSREGSSISEFKVRRSFGQRIVEKLDVWRHKTKTLIPRARTRSL